MKFMRNCLSTIRCLFLAFLLISICGAVSAKDKLPLKPERAVHFETNEVTWLSLDISPDGKTLVIEAVGHLYTLDANGGEAEQITKGMSFNSQPAWSPNGDWIAFISDRRGTEELWIMKPDGSKPRRISSGSDESELASPTWAPDSSHIVVSETTWPQRTFALKAYHLDGGSGVAITRATSGDTRYSDRWNALGAQYSPDGEFLYYAGKYGGFGYDLRFPIWQIYRREMKSGDQDMLTSSVGSAFRPAISPDGRLLVYGTRNDSRTQLRMRDLRTGVDSVLVSEVTRDEQESRFTRDLLPGYTFTPDGNKVIFTADGKIRTVDVNTRDMTEIAFSLIVNRKIGPRLYFPYRIGIGPVKVRLARDVAMSPNGQRAVFTALGKLHSVDLDTGEVQPLGKSGDYIAQPTWSPNGRHLAYVTWSFEGGHVYTMRANGRGKPKRLTTIPAYYSEPLWFSDNKQIIAVRATSQERLYQGSDWGQLAATDLVSIPVGGGDIRVIRPSRGLRTPHLGPDPGRIYLYRSPGVFGTGDSGIVSIRLDGSDWKRHLVAEGTGIYFAQGPVPARAAMLSPDGSHALALSADQLHLFRMFRNQLPFIETNVHNASIPVIQLTDVGADDFGFSSDGKAIHWTVGSTLYVRPIDAIDFVEEEEEESEDEADETQEDEEPDTDNNGGDSDGESSDETENEDKSDGGTDGDEDSAENESDTEVAEGDDKAAEEEKDELKEEHESVVSYELTVYRPRYSPTGTLVLTGATIIPMSSNDEELVENATIVVQNDRFHFVGSDYTPPDDATVMDISGHFVMPGYVDTHAHFRIHREVLGSQAPSLMANLAYGVTTGIDVQPSTVDVLDYQDLVDAGAMIGTRPLSTGPGVFSNNSFHSRSHALAILDRYKKHYRVHNLKAYISGGRKQRQWLVQAAKELQLMPTTEGGLDFKGGITHAIDGFSGHEHNFPSTDLRRDIVELVARSEIAYTPTLLVNYGGPSGGSWFFTNESPYGDSKLARYTSPQLLQSSALRRNWFHPNQYVFSKFAEQALKLVRAGGKVGVGAHGELQGLGYHWELWALHSGGFSNFEALRAATRHGAEMIGISQDVGTLEVGKLADLVVLTANPLEDIRAIAAIRYVMQGGVMRDAETLDEIWPVSQSAPELNWGLDP